MTAAGLAWVACSAGVGDAWLNPLIMLADVTHESDSFDYIRLWLLRGAGLVCALTRLSGLTQLCRCLAIMPTCVEV